MVLVALAALWLSTRPGLSTKARMTDSSMPASLDFHNAAAQRQSAEQNTPTITAGNPDISGQPGNLNALSTQTIAEPDFTINEQTESRNQNEPRTTSQELQIPRFHIVRRGETLSEISDRYYGSANKWQKIYDANRKTIKDANKLRPGTRLIIPE